jgi:hypothetical protein
MTHDRYCFHARRRRIHSARPRHHHRCSGDSLWPVGLRGRGRQRRGEVLHWQGSASRAELDGRPVSSGARPRTKHRAARPWQHALVGDDALPLHPKESSGFLAGVDGEQFVPMGGVARGHHLPAHRPLPSGEDLPFNEIAPLRVDGCMFPPLPTRSRRPTPPRRYPGTRGFRPGEPRLAG